MRHLEIGHRRSPRGKQGRGSTNALVAGRRESGRKPPLSDARLSLVTPFLRTLCDSARAAGGQSAFPARESWPTGNCKLASLASLALASLLAGCASPGLPHPPSLRLPEPVDDLKAERVGDAVVLHWTAPSETTDHLQLHGPMTAVICRDPQPARPPEQPAAPPSCTPVQTLPAQPGAAQTATDALPANLLTDPVQPLLYRVLLRNAGRHDAGPSAPATAASGAAPPAVMGLQAHSAPGGVALTWTAQDAGPESSVQLLREPSAGSPGVTPQRRHAALALVPGAGHSSAQAEEAPVHLQAVPAGTPDRGGALDPTATRDHTYLYTAVRLRTVEVGGSRLVLHSADAAPATIRVEDVAPPSAPSGLVLATVGLAADLSWQPEFAPDLAGYVVYRAELTPSGPATPDEDSWQRVTPAPVAVPAFHDTLPHAGRFLYRVSAVDRSGNQSQPSATALAEITAVDQ